jgi:signal transduction histidine kinase
MHDFGAGIPIKTIAHIFDRRYHGQDNLTMHGLDLRLPIAP